MKTELTQVDVAAFDAWLAKYIMVPDERQITWVSRPNVDGWVTAFDAAGDPIAFLGPNTMEAIRRYIKEENAR